MVIRTPAGANTREGGHHSQSLESWFVLDLDGADSTVGRCIIEELRKAGGISGRSAKQVML